MTERQVAIGETSSYRYIGIEPPLDEKQVSELVEKIILPDWVIFKWISLTQELRDDAPPHTELGFETGTAEDYLGLEVINEGASAVARQVARLLEAEGDDVTVIEHIVPTDFRTPLFGEDYHEMVESAEYYKSRRK